MKAKRILVTGATGFVGKPLLPALLRAGYAVRAITRGQESFPDSVEAVFALDLKNTFDWKPILQGVDFIIHLAGSAHSKIPEGAFSEFDQVNWHATQRLANAAKDARIKRFVYISSVRAQTGPSAARIISEQDEPRPTNQYGRSKLAGEQAVRASGVPFTIFRPVVVYGPHPKGNMQTVVKLARSVWPLPFVASRRSLLAIDNLISAIIFSLNNPTMANEVYLIADPSPVAIAELFRILRKIQGRPPRAIKVPKAIMRLSLWACGCSDLWPRFNGDLVVDTSKLQSAGWRPTVDTYSGLLKMMHGFDN